MGSPLGTRTSRGALWAKFPPSIPQYEGALCAAAAGDACYLMVRRQTGNTHWEEALALHCRAEHHMSGRKGERRRVTIKEAQRRGDILRPRTVLKGVRGLTTEGLLDGVSVPVGPRQ
ncbi:hypothetical protein JZ751_011152 [Albula glossodonta]|uniref:Uncharacterized protein n=1 Tax=Albula glossodonta TaxID=121402 RepID=A0A8T2P4D8_9TELE|nr:hypothetical protein JZ751_011152 [Albula glossodonta]